MSEHWKSRWSVSQPCCDTSTRITGSGFFLHLLALKGAQKAAMIQGTSALVCFSSWLIACRDDFEVLFDPKDEGSAKYVAYVDHSFCLTHDRDKISDRFGFSVSTRSADMYSAQQRKYETAIADQAIRWENYIAKLREKFGKQKVMGP